MYWKRAMTMSLAGIVLSAAARLTHAEVPPNADCSVGPMADGPLILHVAGLPDRTLTVVHLRESGTTSPSTDNAGKTIVDPSFELRMTAREPTGVFDQVDEATGLFLVHQGQSVAGKTYRLLAAADDDEGRASQQKIDDQRAYQGWEVKLAALDAKGKDADEYSLDIDFVFHRASAQVEFSKIEADGLHGRIHLCVPDQKNTFDGARNPAIELTGSFVAKIDAD
jgi:hypothetical protein